MGVVIEFPVEECPPPWRADDNDDLAEVIHIRMNERKERA